VTSSSQVIRGAQSVPPRPRAQALDGFDLPPVVFDDPVHLVHVAILEQRGERLQRRLRAEVKGVLREHLHFIAATDA
jgi:hypothetical protein